MGNIDATLNIKLGELLDNQTELLNRFDLGLTQVEDKKNEALNHIKNKADELLANQNKILNNFDLRLTEIEDKVSDNEIIVNSIGTAGTFGFGVGVAPTILSSQFGLVGLEGFQNPISPNYGNYMHIASGSILVYIPKHYVKYTYDIAVPYLGTKIDISDTPLEGYKLPRVFINNGFEIAGVFVDKYKGGISNNMFVSKRGLDPASTHAEHNPISKCKANGKNPTNTYDGMYDAVKSRGNNFALLSVFLATMMADLADAHYQACHRNNSFSSCAWADIEPYQPKGCNNNALRDTNDSSVLYKSSGYNNCGQTGGVDDVILPKTTHNGQSCGVADVNGLMWEVASGYITSINGTHLILKESVDITTLTSANAYDTDLYETVSIPLNLNNTQVAFGNGTNQFFDGSTDRTSNAYKLDSLGLPYNNNALSTTGSPRFGGDGFWKYQVNEMALIVFGAWHYASLSGLRCRAMNRLRSSSHDAVGGRAYLVPSSAV